MIQTQPWIHLAPYMLTEWQQAKDEGRDVGHLRDLCEQVVIAAQTGDMEAAARAVLCRLRQVPIQEDHPYDEPDDWAGIRAERPSDARETTRRTLDGLTKRSAEELRDRVRAAWIGRVAGCLLGKPLEGMRKKPLDALLRATDNWPLSRYVARDEIPADFAGLNGIEPAWLEERAWIDRIDGAAPVDDDTNYTVLGLKIVEVYGVGFTPDDVLEAWMKWLPYLATCTAERVAYRNAASGLTAPATATEANPFREWIGAQIRADFFGYLCPGQPESAAEMAWRDASISHVRNGIYGEMMVAAMIAAAAVTDDIETIITAGLAQIPARSRLRRDVDVVRAMYRAGRSAEDVVAEIHARYDEADAHDWCHTNANAMIVVMALYYGQGRLGDSICLAVGAAFDTDCNGATVGSLIGMARGCAGIEPVWHESFHDALETSITGYTRVTIDQLTDKTLELIGREGLN